MAELLITKSTFKYLSAQLKELKTQREANSTDTDAASSLHDDASTAREAQHLSGRIKTITSILANYTVLPERTNTDLVGIGNRLTLKFLDEKGEPEELYRLGTPIDTSYNPSEIPCISSATTKGKSLINKRVGEIVGTKPDRIKIVGILPENESTST